MTVHEQNTLHPVGDSGLLKAIILISITGVYFFSMFQRVAVPGTIFDELQMGFHVSAAAIATLGSIYLYIYGGMQVFTGMLADRLGSSRVLVAGGIFLAAGSVFFPLSATMTQLYLTRALVGLGASLIYISMLKHISHFFSVEQFPLVLACSIAAGYSGGVAATYPLERLTFHTGWRTSMLIAGLICLLAVTVSSWLLKRNFSREKPTNSFAAVKKIIRNRRIYPVIVTGSANFSVYFVLQATIGKKMLEDFSDITSSQAAFFTFLMMITAMVSVLLHGYLGKRTGGRKSFAVAAALMTMLGIGAILLNLCFFNSTALFMASYLVCAYAGGNILNPTLIKEISPSEAAGTAVGIYNGAMYCSVAILANIAGMIMDMFGDLATETPEAIIYPANAYRTIFALCLGIGLLSLVSALKISTGIQQDTSNEQKEDRRQRP